MLEICFVSIWHSLDLEKDGSWRVAFSKASDAALRSLSAVWASTCQKHPVSMHPWTSLRTQQTYSIQLTNNIETRHSLREGWHYLLPALDPAHFIEREYCLACLKVRAQCYFLQPKKSKVIGTRNDSDAWDMHLSNEGIPEAWRSMSCWLISISCSLLSPAQAQKYPRAIG